MNIQRIVTLCFSATGNTRKTLKEIGEELGKALALPVNVIDFTNIAEREKERVFLPTDLVVVGTPTFAGKIPNKILPDFQTKLHGNGALALAVVTFGNRSYDNALAELCATLEQDGFHTMAGGAFVGRHSMTDKLAGDRPDEDDLAQMRAFAAQAAQKVLDTSAISAPVSVPGDAAAPYYTPKGLDGQPAKFLKAKPQTDPERCVKCGLCAKNCPMGSIDPADVASVTGICIKCQSCVRNCPKHAKFFDDPVLLSHIAMLEQHYTEPKKNEAFF